MKRSRRTVIYACVSEILNIAALDCRHWIFDKAAIAIAISPEMMFCHLDGVVDREVVTADVDPGQGVDGGDAIKFCSVLIMS
jgi:hypothetical protein